eukprot:7249302-Pyramimonas_sp.AAC.1
MCILNEHNNHISVLDARAIGRFWPQQVAFVAQYERAFKFAALGDFNIPESPPRSFRSPLAPRLAPAPVLPVIDHRGQRAQARWRGRFASVTEITNDLPTRCDSHRLQ